MATLPDEPSWTFGGGTSLAVHYEHRVSYDVDAFVDSPLVVRLLSPARNPATTALLNGRLYDYPGNYLKLRLDGGELDFIVAAALTRTPTASWTFEGHPLALDTPWETAVKKMFHRPSTFQVRDVFDLAAVIEHHPAELAACLGEIADRLPKLIDRVDALRPHFARLAVDEINPTDYGRRYMGTEAAESVFAFLSARR